MREFNQQQIEDAVKRLLVALQQDLTDENIKETPRRVAKYWMELLEGELITNDEIVQLYDKQFSLPTSNNMVVVSNIPVFSHCIHHLALMYGGRITVAYLPKDKVIGLSKISRIADMVCKRLQLQERICEDISYIMKQILQTNSVAVIMKAEHGCVAARGIKKINEATYTEVVDGDFKENTALLQRVYDIATKGER